MKIFVFGKEAIHSHIDAEVESGHNSVTSDKDDDKKDHGYDAKYLFNLLYCFVGLQISYLIWGLLQEKIMTTEYHVNYAGDTFNYDGDIYAGTTLIKSLNTGAMSHGEYFDPPSVWRPLIVSPIIAANGSFSTHIIKFRDSQFLVLINRILALAFSILALVILRIKRMSSKSNYISLNKISNHRIYIIAPLYEFSYCSLSNVLSSWSQYEALKYVNFPTQVSGRMSCLGHSLLIFHR